MNADESAAILELACGIGWNASAATDPEEALRRLRAAGPAVKDDLFLATLAGDVDAVRALLADGADATAGGAPRGWDPLLVLAFSLLHRAEPELSAGMCAVARALLDAGADPNTGYSDPRHAGVPFPALYGTIAVAKHLALAEVLLDAGAKPSDTQSLYHACEWFDTAPLELLGRYALEPDDVSYCVKHALDVSYQEGVCWFVERGADPNARHPGTGETTLHWAVRRAAPLSTLDLLVEKGGDPNLRSKPGTSCYDRKRGGTPLDLALYVGRPDLAFRLVRAGGIPSDAGDDGRFLQACAAGDAAAGRAYLDAHPGAIAALDPTDRARIADVAQQGNAAGVRAMLECGFDPNARGWMGLTALHWAVARGHVVLLELLLERGVPQVDLGGDFGTPLETAVRCPWSDADYADIARKLLAAGAEVPDGLRAPDRPELDALLETARAQRGSGA